MNLTADYSSAFQRDIKRLKKKHIDMEPLRDVISLVLENTPEAHTLKPPHKTQNCKFLPSECLG